MATAEDVLRDAKGAIDDTSHNLQARPQSLCEDLASISARNLSVHEQIRRVISVAWGPACKSIHSLAGVQSALQHKGTCFETQTRVDFEHKITPYFWNSGGLMQHILANHMHSNSSWGYTFSKMHTM